MRKTGAHTSALSFGVLAAMITGPSAHGQSATTPQAGAPGSTAIEQVIVTVQRRSERLARVGVTVTALGAKQLAQRGVRSPADLVRVVPGFQATQSFNGNPVYTLRGVGFDSTNAFSTSPIGIYIDQTVIPYPYMSLGLLFDLARVEVLKGPQGTLYGRNETGGLIDYVTQQPTNHLTAGLTTEVGNYGTINATAFVSGPVADGLDLRLAGNTENRFDGWQQSVTRDETLGVLHQNAVRFIANLDQGGPFTATLTASYWKKDGDGLAPQSIDYIPGNSPFGNPLARASVIANPNSDTQADWLSARNQPEADIGIYHSPPTVDSNFVMTSFKAAYTFSDSLRLESLTSYDRLNERDVTDLAGLQTEDNFQDVNNFIQSTSEEVRLLGDFGKLHWALGGYYANDTGTDRELGYNAQNATVEGLRYLASTLPQNTYTPFQIANGFGNYLDKTSSDTNVEAVFANTDYKFTDWLKASVGGRYTHDSEAATTCTYDYKDGNVPIVNLIYPLLFGHPFNLQQGQCYTLQATTSEFVNGAVNKMQVQSNFSWHASLDFTPTDWSLLYASINRGYKAGGFPTLAASNEKQFDPVSQEELTAYEVGSKLSLLDHAVQINTSLFYYNYKDKQVLGRVADAIFSTLTRIENIPKSDVYGVEWDATWRITPSLTASVSGVLEKSEITQYLNYDEFSQLVNFKGKSYALTPALQTNAQINYDAPINDRLNFSASAAVAYQSETNASFADLSLFNVAPHAIVDSTIGINAPNGKWRFDLYAQNLFNKYYWTGVTSATDSVFRYAGMPRTYGARLTYNF